MTRTSSRRTRQAADAALLLTLSALPYAVIYGLYRLFELRSAAASALWPGAVAPILVAACLAVHFARNRASRPARPAAIRHQPSTARTSHRAA